ncbi:MAG: hypothetical protein ACR2QK_13875 [Acidimicrobiales bacterium]
MSFGPAVIRPNSIPFPTVACAVIVLFFGIQAIIVDSWMAVLSLTIAAVFLLGAAWYWLQARRSSVLIDSNQFIIKDGSKQKRYERSDIAAVDLSSLRGHVTMKDGTEIMLPLEGRPLVEAGLLLTPTGNSRPSGPPTRRR